MSWTLEALGGRTARYQALGPGSTQNLEAFWALGLGLGPGPFGTLGLRPFGPSGRVNKSEDIVRVKIKQ